VSAVEALQGRLDSVFPRLDRVWHDSCCWPFKPGIDQCNGEAALIQIIRAGFLKRYAVPAFTTHIKVLNRTANNQRPQKMTAPLGKQ
jgi:hypothetical protein